MSRLSEAKILGGIGAILMLLGGFFLPGLGAILGLILVFIAVKYISEETKDKTIFDNYLFHFIYIVIAIVAVVTIFFYSIGGFELTFFKMIENAEISDFSSFLDFFGPYLIWWAVALIVGYIFIIISSWYYKKCYYSIAEHTDVQLFRTTGLIFFIGAITMIIGVGLIVIMVAKILEIIAFFRLPEKLPNKKSK